MKYPLLPVTPKLLPHEPSNQTPAEPSAERHMVGLQSVEHLPLLHKPCNAILSPSKPPPSPLS